jgi:hypothetical protein
MEMGHEFATVLAFIDDKTIALVKILLLGHVMSDTKEFAEQGFIVFRDILKTCEMFDRDYQ